MKMPLVPTYVLVALLGFYCWKYGLKPAWTGIHSDFPNYYVSARVILAGEDRALLYDDTWFQTKIHEAGIEEQGKFSSFPPCTAFVMLPLAPFAPQTAKRLWTSFNLAMVAVCCLLLVRLTGWRAHSCLLLLLGCGMGLTNTFRLGQFYLVLTAMIMGAWLLQQHKFYRWAGILLGMAVSLKYMPVVFLLPLLPRKRVVVGVALATVCCITLIEVLVYGPHAWWGFFTTTFLPHLDGTIVNQGGYAHAFQSFNSFYRNLFLQDAIANPHPFLDLPLAYAIAKWATLALIGGVTVFFYRRLCHPDQRFALIGVTTMLVLPASATYHFLLLVPPLALLGRDLQRQGQERILIVLVAIFAGIGFMPYWRFKALPLFFQYPRLWAMLLLWLLVLWVCCEFSTSGEHRNNDHLT